MTSMTSMSMTSMSTPPWTPHAPGECRSRTNRESSASSASAPSAWRRVPAVACQLRRASKGGEPAGAPRDTRDLDAAPQLLEVGPALGLPKRPPLAPRLSAPRRATPSKVPATRRARDCRDRGPRLAQRDDLWKRARDDVRLVDEDEEEGGGRQTAHVPVNVPVRVKRPPRAALSTHGVVLAAPSRVPAPPYSTSPPGMSASHTISATLAGGSLNAAPGESFAAGEPLPSGVRPSIARSSIPLAEASRSSAPITCEERRARSQRRAEREPKRCPPTHRRLAHAGAAKHHQVRPGVGVGAAAVGAAAGVDAGGGGAPLGRGLGRAPHLLAARPAGLAGSRA